MSLLGFKDFDRLDEEVEQLDEVLSTAARIKKRALMKRMRSKIKLGQQKAKKRAASKERLEKRSKKRARTAVAKKLMKKDKKDMSLADRISLEKRLVAKKSMIQRMAKRMLKDVRKDDIKRRTGSGQGSSGTVK